MRSSLKHPEDYDRGGFPIPILLPEVAEYFGVDAATAKHLMAVHKIPPSGLYGGFNRPAVRKLRELLIALGKIGPFEEDMTPANPLPRCDCGQELARDNPFCPNCDTEAHARYSDRTGLFQEVE